MLKSHYFLIFIFLLNLLVPQPIFAREENKELTSTHIKTRSKLPFIHEYTQKCSSLIFTNPKEELKLIEIEGESLFYVEKENENIIEFPFLKNEYFDFSMENRIKNYNNIAEKNSDTPIYIYQVTNARDTSWFDEANYIEAAVPYYNTLFKEQLHSSITFQTLQYKNWYQYQLQNYQTDHHWNVFGAYHGYTDLIKMLLPSFPNIGTTKKPQAAYCSNVRFYGSLNDGNEEHYDTICEFEYQLPSYSVTVNQTAVDDFGQRSKYRDTTIDDNDTSINHYKEFFGQDSAEVIYDFGNNTGINALIISDSYSNAIKPVLASHFDKTVYIDLRHYLKEYDNYFDFSLYQQNYEFDLVLYIGGFYTTIMDESYQINNY